MGMKRTTLTSSGLQTDANALAVGPNGALRIAENVLVERPGTITCRPGFLNEATKSDGFHPRTIGDYGTSFVIQSNDSDTDGNWRLETDVSEFGGPAAPVDAQLSYAQFAEARKNLYVTTSEGVAKICSIADSDFVLAGMHEALPAYIKDGSDAEYIAWLEPDKSVAYQVCWVKRDANDVEVRSAPSPWQTFTNATASTISVDLFLPIPDYVVDGDVVEVYRSLAVPSTGTPSAQMYLAFRMEVIGSEIPSDRTYYLTDYVPEVSLGAELYTNATREGAQKQNNRPPIAISLTHFADCLWFGGIKSPFVGLFRFLIYGGISNTPDVPGFQVFVTTYSGLSGGNTLTGIPNTSRVVVGQLVTWGSDFPAGTRVVSKTANTVTIDQTLVSAPGTDVQFHDGVLIDFGGGISIPYFLVYNASSSNPAGAEYQDGSYSGGEGYGTFWVGDSNAELALNLAYSINRTTINGEPTPLFALAVSDPYTSGQMFDNAATDSASVIIYTKAQNGVEFGWSFITADARSFDSPTNSEQRAQCDDLPSAIAYSKPFEPEHVPPLNYINIGSERYPILALVPLRAALLVFKQDGIYRITGSAPDSWRVDCIEPEMRIFRGECVDVIDGTAYAWTDHGVMAVTEAGAQSISAGAIDFALDSAATYPFNDPSAHTAAWVRTWSRRGLVMVGVPDRDHPISSGNGHKSSRLYVYNTATGAWTLWTFPLYCMAQVRSVGALFAAKGAGWDLRKSLGADTLPGVDGTYSIAWELEDSLQGALVTDLGGWEPKVGDWVMYVDGDDVALLSGVRVTEVESAGEATFIGFDAPLTANPEVFFAVESIACRVQWMGHYVDSSQSATCSGMHLLFDNTEYNPQRPNDTTITIEDFLVDFGASTDVTPTITAQPVRGARAPRLVDYRMTPPRQVARATHYLPYFATSDVCIDWKCVGVALDLEAVSDRTNR